MKWLQHKYPIRRCTHINCTILILVFLSYFSVYGQNGDIKSNLTPQELSIFKERATAKVRQLQGYLSKIASRSESNAIKKIYKDQTKNLFINDGDSVLIEVSSVNSTNTKTFQIPEYLDHLAALPYYAQVVLKSAKTAFLTNFRKLMEDENGNQVYTATATIWQEFTGYDEGGRAIYHDITEKTFEIELRLKPVFFDELNKEQEWLWEARLGDVKVAGTIP